MIDGLDGVAVGHWTDTDAATGCTAILLPEGTRASGEVRGGAPATREWELLAPQRTIDRVDAVVLAGGSAFGLAACDGAVRWCEEHGRGFETPAGRVPIVVGAAIFDLAVGDASVRPGADAGYAACAEARQGTAESGRVGAGTGATVGKWSGEPRPGGIGVAGLREGELAVGALAVVNAWGEPRGEEPIDFSRAREAWPLASTTLAVVVSNAALSKVECLLAAQSGHDGLARALEPAHTAFDGDAVLAAATGSVAAPAEHVRVLAARAVEHAVRSAVEQPR